MPKRRDDVTCHEVDDEALVYDESRHATHRLNSTAYFIWQRCDGRRTCDMIAEHLCRVWDAPIDLARTDVADAVKQMANYKIIEFPAEKAS